MIFGTGGGGALGALEVRTCHGSSGEVSRESTNKLSSTGTIFEEAFRKASGRIGIIDSGFEAANKPPGIEATSGAASAIIRPCSSAFLSCRLLLNFFAGRAGLLAFSSKLFLFPADFSLKLKTFCVAILAPPLPTTFPRVAIEAPLVDGSPPMPSRLDVGTAELVELGFRFSDGGRFIESDGGRF